MDLRQTPTYAAYMQQSGWKVETLKTVDGKNAYAYFRPFPLLPISVCKIQRFTALPDFDDLNRLCKKHHCIYTILEPDLVCPNWQDVTNHGFRLSHSPFLPTASIRIDLTKSQDRLWQDLSTNAKRILTKQTQIKTKQSTISDFYEAWKKDAKIWPPSFKSFQTMVEVFGDKAQLWTSVQDDTILSGILLLKTDQGAVYYQTWTSGTGRQTNAHFYLVWELVKNLKREGAKYLDFDGVYDSRFPLPTWKGFTQFKYKFSSNLVEYPGCFSRLF